MIFYLSFFGIKTKTFNNQIKNNLSKINKKIQFNINEVNYLLNPFNFTINIITENAQILIKDSKLDIKNIKTNISLKSLIYNQLSIDDLKISTKEIKLNDLVLLAKTIHNTPQLFILSTVIKDGSIAVDININFDSDGKIKENYQVEGFLKNTRVDLLNELNLKDLNFSFDIDKNKYSLSKIDTVFNNIKIRSPLIEIIKKKDLYLINGIILNADKKLDSKNLKPIFKNLLNDIDLGKIELSSTNNFSFTINKKLKFNDLKVESILDLDQLTFIDKRLNLKPYFPNFKEEIKFKNHKIKINYNKDQLTINGKGDIFFTDMPEQLSYEIKKNDNELLFNTKIYIKNNSLNIKFLDYQKKEGLNSIVSINGNLKKNGSIKFKSISLKEDKNKILFKNLELNQIFKIVDIGSANLNYKNNKNIYNKLDLNKNNSNFTLEGEYLDATKLINNIMSNGDASSSIFHKLNTRIDIKIKKTYIDEINYINNLSGYLNYKNNKINNLKLDSIFSNKKKNLLKNQY